MWLSILVLYAARLVFSKPLERKWDEDIATKHEWKAVPRGWEPISTPLPDQILHMRIGLRQEKLDSLISELLKISDPTQPSYGHHLSKTQTEDFLLPHTETTELVEDWLYTNNIPFSYRTTDWITLAIPIYRAERLLNAKYQVYQHKPSGDTVIRTLSYSLPRPLHPQIDVISPTTYFGTIKSMKTTSFLQPELVRPSELLDSLAQPLSLITCNIFITPACLRKLYNTTDYVPQANDTNRLGVAGYLGQFANEADLQTFYAKFRPEAKGFTVPTVQVNGGGNDQSLPGIEANLDVQYTSAMSYPTPNIYYSTGGSPPFDDDSQTTSNTNEPYLDWLDYILSQPSVPQVITTSYGDDEQTVPLEYATRVCNLFAQLGARGTTVFFSSGDFGVGGGDCKNNDGTDTVQFQPAFPASCPFVTAVGGTTRTNPEIAVKFSGGGFSRYFPQPAYQAAHVERYLEGIAGAYSGLFNPSGRAYPDVSAQANGYQVVVGGHVVSVGGTSASSPTVAGIFALLNDFRLSQNRSSLGFVNPLLYSAGVAAGFNDIVSGSNPGCHTNGFPAKEGWDPVTGLGTPDFAKLQSLVGG